MPLHWFGGVGRRLTVALGRASPDSDARTCRRRRTPFRHIECDLRCAVRFHRLRAEDASFSVCRPYRHKQCEALLGVIATVMASSARQRARNQMNTSFYLLLRNARTAEEKLHLGLGLCRAGFALLVNSDEHFSRPGARDLLTFVTRARRPFLFELCAKWLRSHTHKSLHFVIGATAPRNVFRI